ncbi:MAG: A/G-specific adenine glycosylase [Phycisphaerae bacterium]|nr:MAG: A/G-specific adenine glycosylase [Phycisphaerae bacterium]
MTPEVLARSLTRWFQKSRRDLPWRAVDPSTGQRKPYHALVSEFMLQQTQVARVLEFFPVFLQRFPTVESLAQARDEHVLAAWAGLGYYRRARLLHAAARTIVGEFSGRIPDDPETLRQLPGVGAYTAGAMASIVFGARVPAVDGNVVRVLLRVHGRAGAADDPRSLRFVHARASELVAVARHPGVVNEGLMELGATVCTPANPRCGACPWAAGCIARRDERTRDIPRPKRSPRVTGLVLRCAVVTDARGRVLLERAPAGALWAGLWRLPTAEMTPRRLAAALGLAGVSLRRAGRARATLSHRQVELRLWRGHAANPTACRAEDRRWFDLAALRRAGVSSAHRQALAGLLDAEPKKRPRRAPGPRSRQ